MNDNEGANGGAEKASGGGLKKALVMGSVGVLLLVVGGFAGPLLKNMLSAPPAEDVAAAEAAPVKDERPALYTSLHPPLVVNLNDPSGGSHYMQVTLEVMAREQHVIDAVKQHSAAIRSSLILLYGSNVDYAAVNTREGKEKMLSDALAAIQEIMQERIGTDGVEAVFFTSLIIQ